MEDTRICISRLKYNMVCLVIKQPLRSQHAYHGRNIIIESSFLFNDFASFIDHKKVPPNPPLPHPQASPPNLYTHSTHFSIYIQYCINHVDSYRIFPCASSPRITRKQNLQNFILYMEIYAYILDFFYNIYICLIIYFFS